MEGWEKEANISLLTLSPTYLQLYEGSTLGNSSQIAALTGKEMYLAQIKSRHSGDAMRNKRSIAGALLRESF